MRIVLLVVLASALGASGALAQTASRPDGTPTPAQPAPAGAAAPAQPVPAAAGSPPPSGSAAAQPGAEAAVSPAPAASPNPGQPQPPTVPENYTYNPEGRRDPFLNLLGQGSQAPAGRRQGDGPAALTVAEIAVRGVIESGGALLAMIQAPDNKTYIVREGDRLADGTIRSVTTQGLIIVQEVNDPLSVVKQREIQKLLRPAESAKE